MIGCDECDDWYHWWVVLVFCLFDFIGFLSHCPTTTGRNRLTQMETFLKLNEMQGLRWYPRSARWNRKLVLSALHSQEAGVADGQEKGTQEEIALKSQVFSYRVHIVLYCQSLSTTYLSNTSVWRVLYLIETSTTLEDVVFHQQDDTRLQSV